MSSSSTPPPDLGPAGRALWTAIKADLADDWCLDAREDHDLAGACRCADELQALREVVDRDGVCVTGSRGQVVTHPALVESRQLRLTQLRLLGAIEMTDPAEAKRAATPAQRQARAAANVRWQRRPASKGYTNGT